MPKPKGLVLYEGPSRLDGNPIVVIATLRSANRKTGDMIQTWVLTRDIDPVTAVKTGEDSTICGGCPFRGGFDTRRCYVNVGQAPRGIHKSYRDGLYAEYDPEEHDHLLEGRTIRFGAYGDPVAAPVEVWANLAKLSSGWTGYTHVWRSPRAEEYAPYCMASTETEAGYKKAKSMGWRSFRLVGKKEDTLPTELHCPMAETTCDECLLCYGAGNDIDIVEVTKGKMQKSFN
jgi:hypothetical protein